MNANTVVDLFSIIPDKFNQVANNNVYLEIFSTSLSSTLWNDEQKKEILLQTLNYPFWEIKHIVLESAEKWTSLREAKDFIFQMTHDSVDKVAFSAIKISGKLKDNQAIPHLVRISGWPSVFKRSDYLRKPVGIGAALTKHALLEVLGTNDKEVLKEKEDEFLKPYKEAIKDSKKNPKLDGMIKVPEGKCTIGTNDVEDFRFFFEDYIPQKEVIVKEFYIDVVPVTNAQYEIFLKDVWKNGSVYGHPDQPSNKDHTPTYFNDPRFNAPDMPVVGVDWYDAYAYASWAGKKLPTEIQWEKAARGTEGYIYPWGNEWLPNLTNYVETCFGVTVQDLDTWEEVLRQYSDKHPVMPVVPVGKSPDAASPYGVLDMAGNIWEWTRTNFYTKKDMDPFFNKRNIYEFMNKPSAFPVIRGGCCTSLPEMLRTFYRGKDLLTDRHFEIGFRCIVEVE